MFVAIIQARMGSTRLPGKVMKKILDKPLIAYLLERVSKSKYIDKIILATTTNIEDNVLSDYVTNLGYEVFRGSEDDVLGRYYNAYLTLGNLKNDVKGIVRITGDCPLFEVYNCDLLINNFINKNLDYNFLSPNFAEGLDCEVFTTRALNEAYKNAKLKSEREHITQYLHNNKDLYKIEPFDKIIDDSKYRITIDEPEDFIVVENIIKFFDKNCIELRFENIKKYLDENQNIFNINSSIIRNEGLIKSLKNDS
jgi:spore coat polysaccharide biosynthesis protein SpsF (cytidylyltransferase family)